MAIVDELVTLLGFEVDDADAKRFSFTLDRIKRGAMVAGTAVTAVVGAIGAFTKSVSTELDESGKFARSIGVDVEALQGLEFATKRAGGSIGDIRGDLLGLTKSLASPIPGEFNQALQFIMGINPFEAMADGAKELKSADAVLLEIADKLKGLSPQKAQIMAGQLGISQGTLMLLVQGREAIADLVMEAKSLGGIIPESATITAADLEDAYVDINTAIKGVSTTIAVGLMPAMTATIGLTTDWIKENRELIRQNIGEVVGGFAEGFRDFVGIIRNGVSIVSKFTPIVKRLTGEFDIFSTVSSAVTAVLILTLAAFTPLIVKFALIVAAIAGTITVVKELIGWFGATGGEFDNVRQAIVGVVDAFSVLFSSVGSRLSDLFSSDIAESFISFLGKLPKAAGEALTLVLGIFSSSLKMIAALFTGDSSVIMSAISGLGESLVAPFKMAFRDISSLAEKFLPSFLFGGDGVGDGPVPGAINSIPSSVNNVSNMANRGDTSVVINISGSRNPSQVGAAVARAIKAPLAQTMQTSSAGAIR